MTAPNPAVDATVTATYDAHWADVVAASRRRLDDDHLAEDIAQEAFARAWTAPGFESVEHCRRFVHVVARNLCVDLQRRRGREVVDSPTLATAAAVTVLAQETDPALLNVIAFEQASAREAVEDLTPHQRDLVLGRHVHELGLVELAESRGTTVGSTRVLLSRAVHRLRRAYEERAAAAFAPVLPWFRKLWTMTSAPQAAIAVSATIAGGVATAAAVGVLFPRGPVAIEQAAEWAASPTTMATATSDLSLGSPTEVAITTGAGSGATDDPTRRGPAEPSGRTPEARVDAPRGSVVVSRTPHDQDADAAIGLTVEAAGQRERLVVTVDLQDVNQRSCADATVSDDPSQAGVTDDCPRDDGTARARGDFHAGVH